MHLLIFFSDRWCNLQKLFRKLCFLFSLCVLLLWPCTVTIFNLICNTMWKHVHHGVIKSTLFFIWRSLHVAACQHLPIFNWPLYRAECRDESCSLKDKQKKKSSNHLNTGSTKIDTHSHSQHRNSLPRWECFDRFHCHCSHARRCHNWYPLAFGGSSWFSTDKAVWATFCWFAVSHNCSRVVVQLEAEVSLSA